MTSINKLFLLSKRIAHKLLNSGDLSDIEDFDLFSKSDQDYILRSLNEKSVIRDYVKNSRKINKKEEWNKTKNELKLPKENQINWYAMAAVLIVILISSLVLIFFTPNEDVIQNPSVSTNNVKKESKGVILSTNAGEIVLENGVDYNFKNAKSHGDQIFYTSKEGHDIKLEYNTLTIPRGGKFTVTLADGTKVWLNSETKIKYPNKFVLGEPRVVELIYGEAYFEVSPSHLNGGSVFQVANSNQVIEVVGTEFNLKAYPDDSDIYTTLVEGKVKVSFGNENLNLLPTQQLVNGSNEDSFKIETVDVYNVISWRDGIFSFENKSFEQIMTVIARWYDYEVVYDEQLNELKFQQEFYGILRRDQNIEDILQNFENLGIIKGFEIDEKQIILK